MATLRRLRDKEKEPRGLRKFAEREETMSRRVCGPWSQVKIVSILVLIYCLSIKRHEKYL